LLLILNLLGSFIARESHSHAPFTTGSKMGQSNYQEQRQQEQQQQQQQQQNDGGEMSPHR
jgi:hypothetical protein